MSRKTYHITLLSLRQAHVCLTKISIRSASEKYHRLIWTIILANIELAALLLSDIILGERSGQVMVRRGKGNKARRVPLNAEARAVICDYLQLRPSTEVQHLLVGQRGEPLSAHAIYDVVVKYGRMAGLDEVSPHTLRHTFARTLLVSGTPINDVADLLGHSSLDTTRIYTKASETDLAAVVARLENW
jgi:integrase/recombinase XerD